MTASVQNKGHGTHAMEPKTPYKASAPKKNLMYLKDHYGIMDLSTGITIYRIIKLLNTKPNY